MVLDFSVVIPCRNEESKIQKCLESLINQNYSKMKYEIIVVEGMSKDNTRSILNSFVSQYPDLIRVYENPKIKQAIGRNIGITKSRGLKVIMFSAHAFADPDYLFNLQNTFSNKSSKLAVVGANILIPKDEAFFPTLIGMAQQTPLGGGGTGFRFSKIDREINSPGFPAYKKEVLLEVGLIDEKLETGEDTDLNWRIRNKGYTLMVSSRAIVFYYRNHNTLLTLTKRLFSYGIGRYKFTKKNPSSFNFLLTFPISLVLILITLPVFFIIHNYLFMIEFGIILLYAALVVFYSFKIFLKLMTLKTFLSIPIFFLIHVPFGLGFLYGLVRIRF